MSWILLATIYGIGFGICLIGGVVWILILKGLGERKLPLIKTLLAIMGWPITVSYFGYKGYQYYKQSQG